MSLKSFIFTIIKKRMTRKMYKLYYTENKEAALTREEYEVRLHRTYKHLDACRFKEKGWPCPKCPNCCFHGKEYEDMMAVMNYVEQWMAENPEKAKHMKPPVSIHKH